MITTEGTVIQVSTASGYAQRTALETTVRALCWFGLMIMLLPVMFAMLIVAMLFSSRSQPSLFSRIGERVLSYWLAGRLLHLDPVPVQDVRVRETRTARIRQVHIAGYLASGSFSTGDRVSLSGHDFHGTLLFREGINHTTQSEIVLR
jgi:hypothetical protein